MSDIGDAIKYLYREFILRDFLSFVTPGAIVVGSMLLLHWDLCQILTFFKSIRLVLYIPIFGILFMVGFAVQCLGAEILPIIKIHGQPSHIEHLKRLYMFRRIEDEKAERQHERFVVLKQMCGNGAFAILIAIILLAIKLLAIRFRVQWPIYVAQAVIVVLIIISLFKGNRVHVRRQEELEDLKIQPTQERS